MKLYVYSIFDSAVKAYARPFFIESDAAAVRAFQDLVNKEATTTFKHPDNFTLMHIGSYDDLLGLLESTAPRSLGNGLQYKDKVVVNLGDPESINLIREIHAALIKE